MSFYLETELKVFIKSCRLLLRSVGFSDTIRAGYRTGKKGELLKVNQNIHPHDLKELLETILKTKDHHELETYLLELTKEVREREKRQSEIKGEMKAKSNTKRVFDIQKSELKYNYSEFHNKNSYSFEILTFNIFSLFFYFYSLF